MFSRGVSSRALSACAMVLLTVVAAAHFASAQQIWVDESTQLSGITLDPFEVLHWLAGVDAGRFGVPGDRMPPVSYWLGWAWSQLFGPGENSLRALSILATGISVALVFDVAWVTFGAAAAWITGLWFGLAPTVLTLGVEIRAYPFLLLGSSITTWLTARLAAASARQAAVLWPALAAACLAACYAHFFGLVMSGAAGVAWLLICQQRKLSFWRPIATGAAIGVGCAGLVPFLLASSAVSTSIDAGGDGNSRLVAGVGRLAYRLLGGHPALGVYWIVAVVTAGAGAICIVCAALKWRRQTLLAKALLVAFASGLAVTLLARVLSSKFDPLLISYNCWMLPPLALLVGSSAAGVGSWVQFRMAWLRVVPALVAVLGVLSGTLIFLTHASTFAHSGADTIVDSVREAAKDGEVIALHDAQGAWGHSYFPLRYAFGPDLVQGLANLLPDTGALSIDGLAPTDAHIPTDVLHGRKVALISTRAQGFNELGAYVRTGAEPQLASLQLQRGLEQVGCKRLSDEVFVAFASSDFSMYDCP